MSNYQVTHTSATNTGIPLTPGSIGGLTVACSGGRIALGGGCTGNNTNFSLYNAGPTLDANDRATGWTCNWSNVSQNTIAADAVTIGAYAICGNVQ